MKRIEQFASILFVWGTSVPLDDFRELRGKRLTVRFRNDTQRRGAGSRPFFL